ncbi:MAG: hypothetical protein V7607_5474 [Solirubrobacteraceae bacterium]
MSLPDYVVDDPGLLGPTVGVEAARARRRSTWRPRFPTGIPHYQVDYWGWSLRELTSLRISQDDMNLVLAGNAARIFKLDVPFTRLFKPPSDQVGRSDKNPATAGIR